MPYSDFSSSARAVSLSVLRELRIRRAPCEANLLAHPAPIPLEAPVISTVLFIVSGLSCKDTSFYPIFATKEE